MQNADACPTIAKVIMSICNVANLVSEGEGERAPLPPPVT